MLGALFGDIVGSVYEFNNTNDYNFELLSSASRPTDDSYMTLAVAKTFTEINKQYDGLWFSTVYNGDCKIELSRLPGLEDDIRALLVKNMQEIGHRYPNAGYGGMFYQWLRTDDPKPYHSFGNGSAMRVSPVGWLYQNLDDVLYAAELTAEVTHNHPEGIKGAQAIAACIYLARDEGAFIRDKIELSSANCVDDMESVYDADYPIDPKKIIKAFVEKEFGYDLDRTLDEIRPDYGFYEICQKSVPEAIIAFLEGNDFEDVIRKAVSLGGDSDTIACMAGAIAEAYYGMPEKYRKAVLSRLDAPMRKIVREYKKTYGDVAVIWSCGGLQAPEWLRPKEMRILLEPDEDAIQAPDESAAQSTGENTAPGTDENTAPASDEEIYVEGPPFEDPFLRFAPEIEGSIEESYKTPGEQAGIFAVFTTLLSAMERDAHVLIPVQASDNAIEEFDSEKVKEGDRIQMEDALNWTLLNLTNDQGETVMPVFTSQKKMDEADVHFSTISYFLDAYMEQVLEMDDVQGLLINPGEHSFLLVKEMIGALLADYKESRNRLFKPSKDAVYVVPENVREDLVEILADFFQNGCDDGKVDQVWFTGIKNGDETSLVIAIKTDTDDLKLTFERLRIIINLMDLEQPVDFMITEKAPWKGAKVVYKRG